MNFNSILSNFILKNMKKCLQKYKKVVLLIQINIENLT